MIKGKVSALGTLSFQPSMIAATIIARLTKAIGQIFKVKSITHSKGRRLLNLRNLLNGGGSATKGTAYLGTKCGDRSDRYHDNESHHDGIFYRSRAVFAFEKLDQLFV